MAWHKTLPVKYSVGFFVEIKQFPKIKWIPQKFHLYKTAALKGYGSVFGLFGIFDANNVALPPLKKSYGPYSSPLHTLPVRQYNLVVSHWSPELYILA